MRLAEPVLINSNGHPISFRFKVIADYCLNFGHFALFILGSQARLRLLVVSTEPFLLAVIAEALRRISSRSSHVVFFCDS